MTKAAPVSLGQILNDARVVFEDEWLVVVSKPSGLAVQDLHEGMKQGTTQGCWGESLVLYHRLDKDTSGLVLFGKGSARRDEVNRAMTQAFEKKRIRKAYLAVVNGRWKNEWNRVETFVARNESTGLMENLPRALPGAKRALTTFRVLASSQEKSWIEAMPKTGRTHQIRLHCLALGCPILGDRYYGKADDLALALHAHRLDFIHPLTNVPICLVDPFPADWISTRLVGLDEARIQAWLEASNRSR
jgi:23S rRNA pseudouridine955/2504/2580 synthase